MWLEVALSHKTVPGCDDIAVAGGRGTISSSSRSSSWLADDMHAILFPLLRSQYVSFLGNILLSKSGSKETKSPSYM